MYGFIYITTNHINGKKYIGQKNYDKNGRWKEYLGSGIILKQAIQKYGVDNFSKEIIEECETKELLNEREKYWISYYNAVKSNKFYNIANGGDGGNTISGYSKEQLEEYKKFKHELHMKTALKGEDVPVSILSEKQVLEIIERLKKNEYSSYIANEYNVSPGTISDIREHKTWKHLTSNIVFDDISKRRGNSEKRQKAVYQYSLTGKLLNKFKSGALAEKETGISRKLISAVCHGEKRQTHGYIWRLECDEFNKYETENSHEIKVDKYDLQGNYIETFQTIKQASQSIGTNYAVGRVINGKFKPVGGFYWVKNGEKLPLIEHQKNAS